MRKNIWSLKIWTALLTTVSFAEPLTTVTVKPDRIRQEFQGLGCGAIYYEGHITSLAERGKTDEQQRLYDAMFRGVNTDFLQLFIRHDHEPQNDDGDPFTQSFKEGDFEYCRHTRAICEAAKKRRPGMKLYAVLYTPPSWMKTNNDPSGGGEARATLKPGLESELGEYIWAFLDYMRRHGQPIDYLSISNESDWPHTQPGYFMTTERYVEVFGKVAMYLDDMGRRHPETPRPKLVAPNNLSAVDCAEKILPPLLAKYGSSVDVVGAHDYDRRGYRWKAVVERSGGRPVWQTENCFNGHDPSVGLIRSAAEQWLAMTEAFNQGVHAWFAYDWVYPPRQGGEALIHVNWGHDFQATKIYHGFRQWGAPLETGMRVVEAQVKGRFASDIAQPGIKASAFLSRDGARLILHVAAVQDEAATLAVEIEGKFRNAVVRRYRTSATEDYVALPAGRMKGGGFTETIPALGLATFVIEAP